MLDEIRKDRFLKQNPYAHLDGDGNFSALPFKANSVEASPEEIRLSRLILQNPHAHSDGDVGYSALKNAAAANPALSATHFVLEEFNPTPKEYYSDAEIETLARSIQIKLWQQKDKLWPGLTPTNPIEILNPEIALRAFGFDFELVETLGQFEQSGKQYEVAGTINKKAQQVQISGQFSSVIRNFTAAHELGHALMHKTNHLHRDRPLDGSTTSTRSSSEFQADKFATYFLMPEKQVRKVFSKIFLTDQFTVTEETAFALGCEYNAMRKMSLREVSRILAKAERYNGANFRSLSSLFQVSEEAMAIRLEELASISL